MTITKQTFITVDQDFTRTPAPTLRLEGRLGEGDCLLYVSDGHSGSKVCLSIVDLLAFRDTILEFVAALEL